MKKFNLIDESVTNHYTPLGNIITNVRNLFPMHPITVLPTQDEKGLYIQSSFFTDEQHINSVIYSWEMGSTCIAEYIRQQGLDKMEFKQNGDYIDVYFTASDIAPMAQIQGKVPSAQVDYSGLPEELDTVKESFNTTLYSTNLYEDESNEEDEDDKEIHIENQPKDPSDELIKQIKDILADKNLRKAEQASRIHELFANHIKFGKNWKIRSVKDNDDNVFVSLRQTYPSKRPFGNDSNITVSRMAFLSPEQNGLFLYDAEHQDNWSDERKKMSNKILKLLKASQNEQNPYLYTIGGAKK